MTTAATQIILASGSPYRRRQLSTQLGINACCIAPNIDESSLPDEASDAMAERLSVGKALAVAAATKHHALIIAGDQTAASQDGALRKPKTKSAAAAQLRGLSGQKVSFYSGICVLDTQTRSRRTAVVETAVLFRELTEQQITAYVEIDNPVGCLGGFKNEGRGIALFQSIRSDDPSALTGLPLICLSQILADMVKVDVLITPEI